MQADRVMILQRFTAALSSAVTMRDVARVLFEQGLDHFGARAGGIVWMMEPRKFKLVYGHGLTEAEFQLLDEAARAGERLPIRDAIISRKPIWLESPDEIRARYPVLEPLRVKRGEYGCAVVPLVVGEWCQGVIGFTFGEWRQLSGEQRGFIEVMAHLSAQAFERARLYEAEKEARKAAEHVGNVQEHLMGVVGHDLRTPLSAIILGASTLLRRADLAPPEARVTVERIAHSAARMSDIIRDLLDVTRARQGRGIAVRMQEVDVGEVARRALLEFKDTPQEHRISLRIEGSVVTQADPARLSQLISNLVGNALQHGEAEPVQVTIVGAERDVTLVVHNGGPAISPELLPHIFEPFTRGGHEPAHGQDAGSVGLGLFIVRDIAQAHRGTVKVESAPGSGTTFTVTLPRGGVAASAPAKPLAS